MSSLTWNFPVASMPTSHPGPSVVWPGPASEPSSYTPPSLIALCSLFLRCTKLIPSLGPLYLFSLPEHSIPCLHTVPSYHSGLSSKVTYSVSVPSQPPPVLNWWPSPIPTTHTSHSPACHSLPFRAFFSIWNFFCFFHLLPVSPSNS